MSIILIFWLILYDIIATFANVSCFVTSYSRVKDAMLMNQEKFLSNDKKSFVVSLIIPACCLDVIDKLRR